MDNIAVSTKVEFRAGYLTSNHVWSLRYTVQYYPADILPVLRPPLSVMGNHYAQHITDIRTLLITCSALLSRPCSIYLVGSRANRLKGILTQGTSLLNSCTWFFTNAMQQLVMQWASNGERILCEILISNRENRSFRLIYKYKYT